MVGTWSRPWLPQMMSALRLVVLRISNQNFDHKVDSLENLRCEFSNPSSDCGGFVGLPPQSHVRCYLAIGQTSHHITTQVQTRNIDMDQHPFRALTHNRSFFFAVQSGNFLGMRGFHLAYATSCGPCAQSHKMSKTISRLAAHCPSSRRCSPSLRSTGRSAASPMDCQGCHRPPQAHAGTASPPATPGRAGRRRRRSAGARPRGRGCQGEEPRWPPPAQRYYVCQRSVLIFHWTCKLKLECGSGRVRLG